ncbi:SRPBCC domain-containing protein [Kitasatospora sp. SUK 42]|uniref:SRPBCC family protein n=1 Tax=Kitasatospora sp. SUK 42 TaxID=1588882 RepID=UPI0018CBB6D4|nr:SRPBCC domain-containing protein [Kitasatospora sp. SUK 42]MBV2152636.1 SRPBCC domain-containing protein [Kitasatospora sp. SUK 42]
MPEIAMQFDIAAPQAVVLAALTTHDGLTSWWTDAVDREGDVLLFDFPDVPEPFRLRLERSGPDRVVWANAGSFPPHWAGTWISWELTDQPDAPERTRLLFRHGGWQPGSEEGVPMVAGTWAELLVRLKDYAQSGKVQPFFVTTRHHDEE